MKHIFNRLTVIIGLLAIFVGSAFATNRRPKATA